MISDNFWDFFSGKGDMDYCPRGCPMCDAEAEDDAQVEFKKLNRQEFVEAAA